MRLFLDANVLFTAAHNPQGRSAALFQLAGAGICSLQASAHALTEARRNIQLKYPERAAALERRAASLSLELEPSAEDVAWASALGLPPEDAPILAAAVRARADVLVTGDRTHFGPLYGQRLRGVVVLTPAQALARLVG